MEKILQSYRKLSIEDADNVRLFNRIDSKFILSPAQLPSLLKHLEPYFFIMEVNEIRNQNYRSVYYDTPNFDCYLMHHRGQYPRFKFRIRSYNANEMQFLELKTKHNTGLTIKKRIPLLDEPSQKDFSLLKDLPKELDTLEQKINIGYSRITLISPENRERLTIDTNLNYANNSDHGSLNNVVIIELKQEKIKRSDATLGLRKHGAQSISFSKYCYCCKELYPNLKSNLFAERNRQVESLNS